MAKKEFNKIIEVNGEKYERIPIKTHKIHIKEPYEPIIEKLVMPQYKKGDQMAISEKFIVISLGRVVHESIVKPGLLAKLISKGVTKYPNDLGFSHPRKIQVAIMIAGWWRCLFAMILGGITRLFGRRGDFYRIAGHRISEIDGFNPPAMPPFNEYCMVPTFNADELCQKIENDFKIPTAIIDGNNIDVQVIGASSKIEDRDLIRQTFIDNPMGQDDELTPIILLRKV